MEQIASVKIIALDFFPAIGIGYAISEENFFKKRRLAGKKCSTIENKSFLWFGRIRCSGRQSLFVRASV